MTGRRQVNHAIEFIDANLHRKVTLDEIAAAANLSPSQLIRLFKAEINTTPVAMLNRKRIRAARRALRETNRPIADIAAEFGYADQSHFARQFKRAMGQTPNAYRNYRSD